MFRMLNDSTFHLGVIAAIIACGVSYKYYQTHLSPTARSRTEPELGEETQPLVSSDDNRHRELEELDEEELMRYLDRLDEGDVDGEFEEYDAAEFERNPEEDVFARSANHVNPPPAAMASASTSASGSSSRARQRNLGKKKARSLARRDRIRQYNEYVRQIANAEREAQREFEEMYADLFEEAKRAREAREEEARQKLKDQRKQKRDQEDAAREKKRELRAQLQQQLQTNGRVRLDTPEHRELASSIPDSMIVDNGQWLVRLRQNDLELIATEIQKRGSLEYRELAALLSKNY